MTMRTDIDYRHPVYRQLGFTKFYQFMVETEDCSPDIAVETWLADDLGFNFEQRCVMAFFHGAAYEGSTEVIMAQKFPLMTADTISAMIKFHDENFTDGQGKPASQQIKRLTRSPDAKHRWRQPEFSEFMNTVAAAIEPFETLGNYISAQITSDNATRNYIQLQQRCMTDWKWWGRMGHWCFSEALQRFIKASIDAPTMEFAQGEGIRQGFAFSIGRDELVEHATAFDCVLLEGEAWKFLEQFKREHPLTKNINYFTLETCCCNYKRQFKGSRYAGCYIDEQYDALIQMKRDWPEYAWLADRYIEGRKACIPHSLLFELHTDESSQAHIKSWNGALRDFGRMPRVEAYFNKQPQRWVELQSMDFASTGSDLLSLME